MLAASLTVPLARQRAPAARRIAGQTERECEIDERLNGIDALAMLLRPAAVQDHRGAGCAEPAHELPHRCFANAGEPLDVSRVIRQHDAANGLEPRGSFRDELLVNEVLFDREVEQT